MGIPFSDITLYLATQHKVGTEGYKQETALKNFISDFYVLKMHGYKPPKTSRITIQSAYYKVWDRTWTNGSIKAIAAEFIYEKYLTLDKTGKYRYILDIIQGCMIQLSEEYNWDKGVFEQAYNEILEANFNFRIEYPSKSSRDGKKTAVLRIEKDERTTSLYISVNNSGATKEVKLFDKTNWWFYDSIYRLVKHSKWLDNDRFGISCKPLNWLVWYSLKMDRVRFEKDGIQYEHMDVDEIFKF